MLMILSHRAKKILSGFPGQGGGILFKKAPTHLNGASLVLPSCCYLIFHLIGSQTFVEFMHQLVALVTAPSSIKACNNDFLCAG